MQADEAGEKAEVVVERLVEHLGLPAETCGPYYSPSHSLWPLGILLKIFVIALWAVH